MSEPVSSPTSIRPDETDRSMTRTAATDTVTWETFPLAPSWKGCRSCGQDVRGERVGVRPSVPSPTPEGIVVRVCSNCGHITTMGPILPQIAAAWPVRNV